MQVQAYLEQATALRREARLVWFAASGATPLHSALCAAAVALERAADTLRRDQERVCLGQSLATYQRTA